MLPTRGGAAFFPRCLSDSLFVCLLLDGVGSGHDPTGRRSKFSKHRKTTILIYLGDSVVFFPTFLIILYGSSFAAISWPSVSLGLLYSWHLYRYVTCSFFGSLGDHFDRNIASYYSNVGVCISFIMSILDQ